MVGQEREGTFDKTGVGKTKDHGAATMQRKSPGTPSRRTPPASTITERTPPATSKGRAMHTRDPWSGGAQGVDGRYSARRSGAPGPHAHGNAVRQAVEVLGQRKLSNDPHSNQHNPGTPTNGHRSRTNGTRRHQHSPSTPTTGLCKRGSNTSRSTGRSSRQNAATRRSMQREERVAVQGPIKKQQFHGMSHRGGGGLATASEGGRGVLHHQGGSDRQLPVGCQIERGLDGPLMMGGGGCISLQF